MTNLEKIYVWLAVSEIKLSAFQKLQKAYPDLIELVNVNEYKGKIADAIKKSDFERMLYTKQNGIVKRTNLMIEGQKISFIAYNESDYPECLLHIDDAPIGIFYKGNISLLKQHNIAVIGSRVCSRYGKEQTMRFAKSLVEVGFNIVSGLADGIDTYSVQAAIEAGNSPICVLANGLSKIYPAVNTNLAQKVLDSGGLLISEYHPEYTPKNYSFVKRNRIVASISDAVLVTEAGRNSGALHTVNYAVDLGKEIFAIPANCDSITGAGSNDLIKKYYCSCVTEPSEIIDKLKENIDLVKQVAKKQEPIQKNVKHTNLNEIEQQIIDFVKFEDMHFDKILEKTKLDTKSLLVLLTMMEIRGLICKLPGNYYGIGR